MKNLVHNLYLSEKLLLVVGLSFVVMVSAVFAFGIGDEDTDADGIVDSTDICPGTIVDKPAEDWSVNRYLWIGGEYFTILEPGTGGDKNKVFSELSMIMTKGCSCIDIVKATNDKADLEKSSDYKFGCTKGAVDGWIRTLNK